MDQADRIKILKNYDNLLTDLQVEDILPELIASGVISIDDAERCQFKHSTTRDRAGQLITILLNKGPNSFTNFVRALENSQPHLSSMLQNSVVTEHDMKQYEQIDITNVQEQMKDAIVHICNNFLAGVEKVVSEAFKVKHTADPSQETVLQESQPISDNKDLPSPLEALTKVSHCQNSSSSSFFIPESHTPPQEAVESMPKSQYTCNDSFFNPDSPIPADHFTISSFGKKFMMSIADYDEDFERAYSFASLGMLPKPDPFVCCKKLYPSEVCARRKSELHLLHGRTRAIPLNGFPQ